MTLTHLEAPLVDALRSPMVVSVLAMVSVTLLVVLMARGRRSSVTLGWSGSLHFWCVDLRGSCFGSALNHRLVLTVTAVGWRSEDRDVRKTENGHDPTKSHFPFLHEICNTLSVNKRIWNWNSTADKSTVGIGNQKARHVQISLPVFLFFFGGTPRLLRFGLCFFEAPPVCDSFCRFWLADAAKKNRKNVEWKDRLWNELSESISLLFNPEEK